MYVSGMYEFIPVAPYVCYRVKKLLPPGLLFFSRIHIRTWSEAVSEPIWFPDTTSK